MKTSDKVSRDMARFEIFAFWFERLFWFGSGMLTSAIIMVLT